MAKMIGSLQHMVNIQYHEAACTATHAAISGLYPDYSYIVQHATVLKKQLAKAGHFTT